ncbi:meiosis regulator and mRNA stability factor 1 [Schistocerca americana]|uniref:meiosis regulator and mRNA stability factor 1 n=1 Tax=Schistocerca americana TaxID=7009 RepID=UPI001F4FFA6C|nr:meiosis regulator and mRNA stability factor 1 [Schistocerca americana]
MEKTSRSKPRQESLCLDEGGDGAAEAASGPQWLRPVSASATLCFSQDSDDSSGPASPLPCRHRAYQMVPLHAIPRFLPPVGVFWDIENCQVPKGRSAVAVVQVIRDRFFKGYREAEFLVVCDVKKENNQIVKELNDAQVNLIHVASTCKNAADEKLRQSIRRFADLHGSPACIILISGDINFAPDITDLRHRKKIHVILLHRRNTSEALILSANENYSFSALAEELPLRAIKPPSKPVQVVVNNLPEGCEQNLIRNRLRRLSDNCGGKIAAINKTTATIRFPNADTANRAQKRMDGEDVYGNKIQVTCSDIGEARDSSPNKTQTARNTRQVASKESGIQGTMSSLYYKQGPRQPSVVYNSVPTSLNLMGGSTLFNRASVLQQNGNHQLPVHSTGGSVWPKYVMNVNTAHKSVSYSGGNLKTPEGYRRIRGTHRVSESGKAEQNDQNITVSALQSVGFQKRCRTSSPVNNIASCMMSLPDPVAAVRHNIQNSSVRKGPSPSRQSQTRSITPHQIKTLDERSHSNPECFFHPIQMPGKTQLSGSSADLPVELHVSNLDQNLSISEIKSILTSLFKERVPVCSVSVIAQTDGNIMAFVKVPTLSDAQLAISLFHRYKIGYRRILISYGNTSGPSPQIIRSQVITLLLEVPDHRLPLFKFREMFEKRYLASISVSDIYKLRDVCVVSDGPNGRMVTLNPDHRHTPSPCLVSGQENQPYCVLHAMKPQPDRGWAEQELSALPSVNIGLKLLSNRIKALLLSHGGSLPLPSLPYCYLAVFDKLEVSDTGVPLEHLVSCLHDVKIIPGPPGCVKKLVWSPDLQPDSSFSQEAPEKSVSPPLANHLALLSRELVDLLKIQPGCQLPFGRFVPAYHHHFGRQIRVADYGFTKLVELLDAMPSIVQVMGEGSRRIVTLAHRAQIRRFTSDLLRVLKSQASKQALVSELPAHFSRTLGRPFAVQDYGVCELEDLLSEVAENVIVMQQSADGEATVALPRRDQTPEEIKRTKQFAAEVVELLSHAPQCQLMFNKLIPAYHHHFGRQCRVADFGFTKLIELLEAIPEVIKVEDAGDGERRVMLTQPVAVRVLTNQVAELLHISGSTVLPLKELPSAYLQHFGHTLRPEDFNCSSIEQLVSLLTPTIKVLPGLRLYLAGQITANLERLRVLRILLNTSDGMMRIPEFIKLFTKLYSISVSEDYLQTADIAVLLMVQNGHVILQPVYEFARRVYWLVVGSGGRLLLSSLNKLYFTTYHSTIQAASLGFSSMDSLIIAAGDVLTLEYENDCNNDPYIAVNPQLAEVGLPLSLPVAVEATTSEQTDSSSKKHSFSATTTSAGNQDLVSQISNIDLTHKATAPFSADYLLNDKVGSNLQNVFGLKETRKSDIYTLTPNQSVYAWGGQSPPTYAPYCLNTAFSPYKGGNKSNKENSNWPENIVPPHPSELPLPSPCLVRADTLLQENDSSEKQKRKKRLAAQFSNPLEMP